MTEVLRSITAVFRCFPDPRGNIRMIHNGVERLEVDETIEALWFAIDNHTPLEALYHQFLDIIAGAPSEQARKTFEAILKHFVDAGFIELDGTAES